MGSAPLSVCRLSKGGGTCSSLRVHPTALSLDRWKRSARETSTFWPTGE